MVTVAQKRTLCYSSLTFLHDAVEEVSFDESPHLTLLTSLGPVAHKAKVNLLHLVLSAATRLAAFQLFHPSIRL